MASTVVVVAAAIAGSAWWLLGVAATSDGKVNAIRSALTAGAAAGGGMGLLLAFRRQQFHETDATEQRVTGRYTAAIDQLGSDKTDVRIGGIYALERLARDSPADHPTIMDVLASFVRAHAGTNDDDPVLADWMATTRTDTRGGIGEDVRAATIVIARREARHDALTTRLDIPGADAHDAHLPRANLSGAILRVADLSGAYLTYANLTGVDLGDANLTGANLRSAYLTGANLCDADLTYANLRDANLTYANLGDANLTGANLRSANLTGANLRGVDLADANLVNANLTRADLTNADPSRANLTNANLTDTLWPEGFSPPAPTQPDR